MTFVNIALGGMLGAILRALLAESLDNKNGGFPFGTFAANMVSSFLLGALIELADSGFLSLEYQIFFETGFCATLSTFSSMAWQIVNMLRRSHPILAATYAMTTFCCGMALFIIASHIFAK